ncbi:MAG: 16S rRNA (uracil(1498)-N(3))-methyltransferase [Planctomycetia bacterium]|nr:16S rRNA (uracil(1498)-N(3))-methyltransferase [Planctomycetia bacterium]
MSYRFYCDQPLQGASALLEGSEAHHLSRVLRLDVGEEVVLFDGQGSEFAARVRHISKARVDLDILHKNDTDRELPFTLILATALPKGDRQKWLVEKAVELGVTRLVPLRTRRGVAQPDAGALERLRRAVIEASKQCCRNRLMAVDDPVDLVTLGGATLADAVRVLAQPATGAPPAANVLRRRTGDQTPCVIAVGPEGGFTDEEVAAALSAGWQAVELGPRILRVETAALMLAALAAS